MQGRLVFFHGFMGDSSDWDEVRALLPEFDSVAISIPAASNWHGSIQKVANSIEPGSILIGYSMGARLALGVAIEFPAHYGGLVFVSGNPGLESERERVNRELADEKIAGQIEQHLEHGKLDSFLDQWYQASVFESLPADIRSQEISRKLKRDPQSWPMLLRTNSVSQQPNYWPRLNDLSMPTLVVAGQRDEKYKEIAVRFKTTATLNHVKTELLDDCGHMVHREQPVELADLIREFVMPLTH